MRFRHAALRTGVAATAAAALAVALTVNNGPDPAPMAAAPPAPVAATPPATPSPAPSSAPALSARERSALTRALTNYLDDRDGRLSVAIKDLATGVSYSYAKGVRTATASVVKVDILVALLLQAQRDDRALTASERSLAARMIRQSDNAAATALWNTIGGGPALDRANRRLGLRQTTAGPGAAWGSTTTGAADQVRLLTALTSKKSPLTAAHRAYVLRLMGGVVDEQAWGVSAAAGDGDTVALKNGWLPRRVDGGAWTVTSMGRITGDAHDYLIAVVSAGHPSLSAGVTTVEHAAALTAKAVTRALA
ncbi:serine hydrolase [Spirillospora sp. NPDC047279]|uniref:serine hydrolase n=1 Tax=Spirillospora sp. NPDC047279 TaxID=3155478 RepID=UPI0033F05969